MCARPPRRGAPVPVPLAPRGEDSFDTQGVIAWVDECHRERFNFEQRLWLDPAVAMGSRSRAECEALALNVLTRLIPARTVRVGVGVTSRQALRLVPQFVQECLAARDPECLLWRMPLEALRAWLGSHGEFTR